MTCDCDPTLGHVCPPPWMDANEWPTDALRPAELHECDGKMGETITKVSRRLRKQPRDVTTTSEE